MMDKTKMQMGDCSEGCRGRPGATRHIFFAPCHVPHPAGVAYGVAYGVA